jgi:hypothetical protein
MSASCEFRAYVRASVLPAAGRQTLVPRAGQGVPSPNTFAVITSNSQVMAAGYGALLPPLLAPSESAVA